MDMILIPALRYLVLLYSMALLSKRIHNSVLYLTYKEISMNLILLSCELVS